MNNNFYWLSPCYQFFPENPNNFYLDSLYVNPNPQETQEPSYDELLKKCQQLETENSQLKEELAHQKRIHIKKRKRIIKRRKEEELQKVFKCPHADCKKEYASSLALNLHIKNKHFKNLYQNPIRENESAIEQNEVENKNEFCRIE